MNRTASKYLLLLSVILFASCGHYKIKIKPAESTKVDLSTATINVYIENSGSMDGYVIQGAQFKDDLYSYVSALSSKVGKTNYNYINTQIIPVKQADGSFFQNLSPAAFKAGGGDRQNSELVDMMRMMLKNENDNTISVFASDCILDPTPGDASKFFYLRQTDMRNTISSYLAKHKDFGIIIFNLESNFDGFMFPVGAPARKVTTKRPYYVWVFGPNNLLGALTKEVPSSYFINGVKHSISFVKCPNIPFTVEEPFSEGHLHNNEMNLNSKDRIFHIKADFSSSLLSETYITNPSNYKQSDVTIRVEKVDPIKGDDLYTHDMTISYRGTCSHGFYLDLNTVSSWVEAISDDNGSDIKKTCGIEYIINGIAEAYKETSPLQIDFEIKK
jgi:hypothetical protein